MWLSNGESITRVLVLILMLVMGIQDLRTRRVSNYLTIPFFFTGLIANGLRAYSDLERFQFILFVQAVVVFAGYRGWMGGADMKVFGGLLGLVPEVGIAAIIASGVVGSIVWAWTGDRKAKFPAITVSAVVLEITMIVVNLTTLLEVISIMFKVSQIAGFP